MSQSMSQTRVDDMAEGDELAVSQKLVRVNRGSMRLT